MTTRVLLVDDDAKVVTGIRRQLHKRFDLHTALSGAEALRILACEGPFAVLVADMRMPGMDGFQLFEKVRQQFPDTVHIMLTGDSNPQTPVKAINEGHVFRFLAKPCTAEEVAKALNAGLAQHQSMALERRLVHLARYDYLTGVAGHALFQDRLSRAFARAKRNRANFAVLFLDLDRFKEVNDTLGHDVGDLLLKTTAERLQTCVREVDTVARLGGDEFTLILEAIEHDQDAVTVARRILDVFAAPIDLNGHRVRAKVSIGIATYPSCGKTAKMLVKNADTAMYRAKNLGGNAYRVYTSEPDRKR
jgi:diguanylate cyclase (GGDEF)-like protein